MNAPFHRTPMASGMGAKGRGDDQYERMCEAIACCEETLEAELTRLPLEDQLRVCLRIAGNYKPERKACEIRMRAERGFSVLLRDGAGLPPRNKRDAKWLAEFAFRGEPRNSR